MYNIIENKIINITMKVNKITNVIILIVIDYIMTVMMLYLNRIFYLEL